MREVRTWDQRSWTIRREINWRSLDDVDHRFEHDIAAGRVAGIVMTALIIVMVTVLAVWKPSGVYLPSWLLLTFIAVVLLVPAQWALARPWTIEVHTYQPLETSGETWRGTVRGLMASRYETSRVARNLELEGRPDDPNDEYALLRRVAPEI